jgi:hypothetical protein
MDDSGNYFLSISTSFVCNNASYGIHEHYLLMLSARIIELLTKHVNFLSRDLFFFFNVYSLIMS